MSEGVVGKAWKSNRANFDRNLAAVIGIDRYSNDSIRNLSTAASDARAIADLLEQKYAYKQSNERPEVIRLFDEEATLAALQHLFHTKIPKELNPGESDRLIIYFAGHGLPRSNDEGPEGYLVPHDADPTEPASFLAMRDISKALDELKCHHLLVILDCCFAGTFRWAGSRKAVPILKTIHQEHYYHFIRYPAWQVITSSAHDQEALDIARLKEDNRQPVADGSDSLFEKEPHSPFALALLEGLHPGNGSQRVKADLFPDGVMTAHELFVYLQTRVKQLSGERQAPGIYPLRRDYDKGEFVFTPPEFKPEDLAKALPLNEENNPYRGLKSFDEKHADFFFGRQMLTQDLIKRLTQHKQVLTVVLGVSGSGKSSLVKAGLIPHLRNQRTGQWRILYPMRPGELPFTSLSRTLLPIAHENLLERLTEVSFLDSIFQRMLKPDAKLDGTSVDETLRKVADSWCSAKPEAKLLLIEDYYPQLETLGNPQQKAQLKSLYDQILEKLVFVNQQLQDTPQYFSQIISIWHQNHLNMQLLLVIDQFEELLTRSQDDRASSNQSDQQGNRSTDQKEWQKFLEILRIAISNHSQTLCLVLTLRSDFEPRFLSSALELYWKDARFPVRAMTSDELRQAIENPALKQAIYFEELKDEKGNITGNLVSKLVDEVGQMPGALSLLSFTLSELYVSLYKRWQRDQSTDRTLRFVDYEALGGVAGALTRRATEEYEALDEKHQTTMQRVMLRMVVIEGTGVARRRVNQDELLFSDDRENERVKAVTYHLINSRLLVSGRESNLPYIEPAHDFLVRGWDKLQSWIRQNQESLTLQQRLIPATHDWLSDGKTDHFLWNADPRLNILQKLIQEPSQSWLNQLETEFIRNSIQKRDTSFIAEEEQNISMLSRASNVFFDSHQHLEALIEAINAGKKLKQLQTHYPFWVNFNLLKQVKETLQKVVYRTNERNRLEIRQKISAIFFGSDSQLRIATINDRSAVCLFNLRGERLMEFLPRGDDGFSRVVTVSTSSHFAAAVNSKWDTVYLWDLEGKDLSQSLRVAPSKFILFSNDERLLVVTEFEDNIERFENKQYHTSSVDLIYLWSIHLWNLETQEVKKVQMSKNVILVAGLGFDNQNQLIIATLIVAEAVDQDNLASNYRICLINIDQKELFVCPKIYHTTAISLTFSPDCKWAVISYGEESFNADLWNLSALWEKDGEANGDNLKDLNHPLLGSPRSATFSKDSELLALAYDDTIRLLRLHEESWGFYTSEIKQFRMPRGGIQEVCFSHDGRKLATSQDDGTIHLWDTEQYYSFESQLSLESVNSLSFSPDNQKVAIADFNANVCLLDLKGNLLMQFPVLPDGGNHLSFSPDGQTIATVSNTGSVHFWDLGGQHLGELPTHSVQVEHLSFSPDSQMIATIIESSNHETVRPLMQWWHLNYDKSYKPVLLGELQVDFMLERARFIVWEPAIDQKLNLVTDSQSKLQPDYAPLLGIESSGDHDWGSISLRRASGMSSVPLFRKNQGSSSFKEIVPSTDGTILVTTDGHTDTLSVWKINIGVEKLMELKVSKGLIKSIHLSPDNSGLAIVYENGAAEIQWFGLDELLLRGSHLVGEYLRHNPNVSRLDRTLCSNPEVTP